MSIQNSCRFLGRLGQDPELRYLPSGTAVVNVGLAVNGRRKVDDEWVDETTWVDLSAFGSVAESLAEYTSKGTQLLVEAEYQKRRYTNSEGEERTAHNFIVREWRFAQSKQDSTYEDDFEDSFEFTEDDEELPF